MSNLVAIPRPNIPDMWPQVENLVKRALRYSHGRYTTDEIYNNLMGTGKQYYQMWIVWDDEIKAVFVSSIEQYQSGKRTCNLILTAGKEVRNWLDAIDQIGEWAKAEGCDSLYAVCRPGWEKIVDYDYKHVMLERKL